MTILSPANLIRFGALLILLCAVLHSLAWVKTREVFPAEAQSLATLLWFLLAIDWAVIGVLWLAAAQSGLPMRNVVLISSVIPFAVAAGLAPTMGPTFPPIYLQLSAAVLAVAGALNLK